MAADYRTAGNTDGKDSSAEARMARNPFSRQFVLGGTPLKRLFSERMEKQTIGLADMAKGYATAAYDAVRKVFKSPSDILAAGGAATIGAVGVGADLQKAYAGDRPPAHVSPSYDANSNGLVEMLRGASGDPMDEFPITLNRLATIPLPGGVQTPENGFFMAGAGNANHPTEANYLIIGTTTGDGLKYDITQIDELTPENNTPLAIIATAKTSMTGLTRTATGYALTRSGDDLIHLGTIANDVWSNTGTIQVAGLGIDSMEDITFARGFLYAVTDNDELLQIMNDGSNVPFTLGGSFQTVTVLQLAGYNSDLFASGQKGEGHTAMDNGLPTGISQNVTYNPAVGFDVVGVAHVGSGIDARTVVVTAGEALVYEALPHSGSIESIGKSADFDGDGNVDLVDASTFQFCYGNIGATAGSIPCDDTDINDDGSVDDLDTALFAAEMTGPN